MIRNKYYIAKEEYCIIYENLHKTYKDTKSSVNTHLRMNRFENGQLDIFFSLNKSLSSLVNPFIVILHIVHEEIKNLLFNTYSSKEMNF
ncbi:hypothetical protein RIR_jg23249.t1 [Rhizophagus irregularis DAOM 181602=DAOM 197198]|nr:hypothetical protein RIR_jg23249.t1 [Rhizophagus irregularis DAOM 181602=DAOM 197198]